VVAIRVFKCAQLTCESGWQKKHLEIAERILDRLICREPYTIGLFGPEGDPSMISLLEHGRDMCKFYLPICLRRSSTKDMDPDPFPLAQMVKWYLIQEMSIYCSMIWFRQKMSCRK
jgi:hypothetical protein